MNEKVSIITPVFNSEKYISQTIRSVLNQEYKNFELIIIDNNSKDDSINIIEGIRKEDKRIKLIKLDNNYGPAKARNIGIKEAKGKYITFLDSDDILDEKYILNQVKYLNFKKAEIVYSSFYKKSENLSEIYGINKVKDEVTYKDLLRKNYLSCLTTMIDISVLGKFYFKEGVNSEDHLYWLELLRDKNIKAIGNDEILATYRIRKGSLSRNKVRAAKWKWNIYRKYLKLDILKSLYYFTLYTINGLMSNFKVITLK